MNSNNGGNIFYGWWVVLASAAGLSVHFGPVITMSFGIFIKPSSQEFGWGRADISLAFTFATLAIVILQPVTGLLIDRVGARRVILPGAALLGCSVMAISLSTADLWFYYLLFTITGVVGTASNPVSYSKIVAGWFDRRRGLALALAVTGSSLATIIWPKTAQLLISGYGWRTAYLVMGAVMIAVAVPAITLWLRDKPEDMGLRIDGLPETEPNPAGDDESTNSQGLSFREARRTAVFWLMISAFALVSFSFHGTLIHLVPMLTDRGISPGVAASATSVLAVGIISGRLATGLLLDRYFAPYVALAFFCCATVGLVLLASEQPVAIVFAAAVLLGLAEGAELDIMPYMVSRYFGLKAFGTIYSYAFSAFILGGVLGPYLMGATFDKSGSYAGAMPVMITLPLLAAACMWRMPSYRSVSSA